MVCLCSKGELSKYRVQWLLHEMTGAGLTVHHFPFPDGQPPTTGQLMKILEELKIILNNKKKPIIQYVHGFMDCLLLNITFTDNYRAIWERV